MENAIKMLYIINVLLYIIVIVYLILEYLKKKLKKTYKFGYYIISPKIKHLFYIFKKKNGKYSFHITGDILINLKYSEAKTCSSEIKAEFLNIKLSEKFSIFLNKDTNLYIFKE